MVKFFLFPLTLFTWKYEYPSGKLLFIIYTMNPFESRLSAVLKQHPSCRHQAVYLAGVSGGADSAAMLAGLAALRREAGFTLHCIHVEHGIRPAEESLSDARAVEALCAGLKVPCRVEAIPEGRIKTYAGNGGPGIEGAARIFRHKAFNAEARRLGADWILTAHTQDDLLETLLMRILKGAGPAGLAPMRAERGRFLRPLLNMTRQDVISYLKEKNLPYRTDSTNSDIRFLRNRIRLKLVPLLDSFFPFWRKTILSLAETQALTSEFIKSELCRHLSWDSSWNQDGEGRLKIPEGDFLKAHALLREEAVFAGADFLSALDGGEKRRKTVPRREAVRRAVENFCADQSGVKLPASDLGPVRIEGKNGFVFLSKPLKSSSERGFSLLIKEPGLYTLKGKLLGLKKSSCLTIKVWAGNECGAEGRFEENAVFSAKLPAVLRSHRPGDRIIRGGHKRRLSDILDASARSECKGIISVCDADGLSAFIAIGSGLTVLAGDKGDAIGIGCFFEFGGLDV